MKKLLIASSLLLSTALLLYGMIVNGFADFTLRAAPGNPASGFARVYVSSSTNLLACLTSAGVSCMPGGTATIASGTSALGTSAIASGTCASTVTTSATGTATTDNIMADFNASPLAVTGYIATSSGMLAILKWPTANNVNFAVCNNTAGSITPGAITLNWRVVR